MSRYERVPAKDEEDTLHPNNAAMASSDSHSSISVPVTTPPISSRPPSFSSLDPLDERNERFDLAASFEPDDDDDDEDQHNEQSRLHPRTSTDSTSSSHSHHSTSRSNNVPSQLAVPSPFSDARTSSRYIPKPGNDGVFANLEAKDPDSQDKYDEPLPSYEAAAADAVPPYWETTIITPGMDTDEVYVDGLPVGNFFAFVWNAMISMSFQFVGFLLTYLLASSHAARNGSRAGLGVILIQYGFYLRDAPNIPTDGTVLPDPNNGEQPAVGNDGPVPDDNMPSEQIPKAEWMSYLLMVIGWFVLIRSIGEYYRVKQLEKAVRATPAVGGVPTVIAEGEGEEAV